MGLQKCLSTLSLLRGWLSSAHTHPYSTLSQARFRGSLCFWCYVSEAQPRPAWFKALGVGHELYVSNLWPSGESLIYLRDRIWGYRSEHPIRTIEVRRSSYPCESVRSQSCEDVCEVWCFHLLGYWLPFFASSHRRKVFHAPIAQLLV